MEGDQTLFSAPIRPQQFPGKLWHLVNDPLIVSVCWDSSGEGILVSEEAFTAEILSPGNKQAVDYFKLTGFNSFIRQMNLYGFKKVPRNHDISYEQLGTIHHFHNQNFKRANPELLANMKRLTPTNRAKLAAGLEVPSHSRRFQYLLLLPPQEYEKAQKAPRPQSCNGFQHVEEGDATPGTSRAFVSGEGTPGIEFHNLLKEAPSAHPYNPMQEGSQSTRPDETLEAFIPHHTEYRLTASVFDSCSSGSFNSIMLPASFNQCVCYPDCSFDYLHYDVQTPNRQAGDASDCQNDWNPITETQTRIDTKAASFYHIPSNYEKPAEMIV